MELFGPTILRNFPLTKSDILGIFKNILTGFYCIYNSQPFKTTFILKKCVVHKFYDKECRKISNFSLYQIGPVLAKESDPEILSTKTDIC
jgi:hypothetical protein